MKKDIKERKDIELLINSFYETVKKDPTISHFFIEVVKLDWDKHLPKIYDFWEDILFHTGKYNNNQMLTHKNLHQLSPLKKEDFQQWLKIFRDTANKLFEGPNTEIILQRAHSIATVMELRVIYSS